MTPKERAAMQQALEALEFEFGGEPCGTWDAITALREALAEQAEQEPIRFVWNGEGWIEADEYVWKTTPDAERRELYAEPVKHKLADVIAPKSGYDIDADPLYQQGYSDALKEHWSDCSVNNEPAYPNAPCDCGGYTEAEQKPAAYLSDLSDPQPHAVTDLKYCSWAQHERGDHLKYVPVYAAPVQQVTRADLKAAFKEGFERAADLYAPNDGQEPYAYEVWDVQDQSFTMIYATQLKEFHWIEPENIARVLYAAPVQQAEQEPVAVVEITYGREPECYVTGNIDDFPEGVFKLYASPVRTKDLTDDEERQVITATVEGVTTSELVMFKAVARAVIAADREKNK